MNKEIRPEERPEQPEQAANVERESPDSIESYTTSRELADEKLEDFDSAVDDVGDEEDSLQYFPDSDPDDVLERVQPENELSSRFSAENFKAEDSFDTYAKENYPELNNLKSKCVYDVSPMGTTAIDRSPKAEYTQEERDYLKDAREKVDTPTTDTVMQKVIGVDTGDIKKDLDRYLNPHSLSGNSCEPHVCGCVAKAEDAAPFTRTPQECHDNLRLDYPDTQYTSPEQSVYVVRFTDGKNYDVPYNQDSDGKQMYSAPMTGNGFTGSENHIIPEYTVREQDNKGAIVTDGEIYRINPDGTEEAVAYYNKKDHAFELYKETNNQ